MGKKKSKYTEGKDKNSIKMNIKFKDSQGTIKRNARKRNKTIKQKHKEIYLDSNDSHCKSFSKNVGLKKSKHAYRDIPLRERMIEKLKAAKFRFLNEKLYTSEGNEIANVFKDDESSYEDYHKGFRQQVARWPINPVDVIIKELLKKTKSSDKLKIADFGCGEAKISENLEGHAQVYSFDLVALNDRVTQCDMAHTKLQNSSMDVAVFCLSLMGKDLSKYIAEANRILKEGGILKIAEVESRFQNVDEFMKTLERFGFKIVSHDLSHKLFYFMDLKKVNIISKKRKNKLPDIELKPCLYKKR